MSILVKYRCGMGRIQVKGFDEEGNAVIQEVEQAQE
jgi:hypothetical protein